MDTPLASLRQLKRLLFMWRTLPADARGWLLRRQWERATVREQRVAAALASATGRLVFVCHGNIMRSAFATVVARSARPAVAARVVGAGTHATQGRPAQDSALRVAAHMDLPLAQHQATPLVALQLCAQDVVVCMDAMNEANVLAQYPLLAPRVFRVGDVCASGVTVEREIADPYGKGDAVTEQAFARVAELAKRWVERLP